MSRFVSIQESILDYIYYACWRLRIILLQSVNENLQLQTLVV